MREDEDGEISVDFLKAFEEITGFLSSKKMKKNLDESLNIINDEFEEIDPEMQEWLEDQWDDRWSTKNKDRWNFKN